MSITGLLVRYPVITHSALGACCEREPANFKTDRREPREHNAKYHSVYRETLKQHETKGCIMLKEQHQNVRSVHGMDAS